MSSRRASYAAARPPAILGRRPLRPFRAAGKLAGGIVLASVAVGVGVVVAAMAVTSEPDSATYSLRRVAEDALVMVHRNPVSRASLEVDLSDQRLREAEAMALQGHADLAVTAVHDHFVELRQAARALIDASAPSDASWRAARAKLGDAESDSLQTVETQLTLDGDGWAANQVKAEVGSFASERHFLDQELGPAPAPSAGSGSSTGQPPSAP